MSESKNNLVNKLLNIDLIISGIAFIVLVCITFSGVIYRYVLNNPIIWMEEVQLICMVLIVYFGISAAVRSGSHVAIDMIVDRLPKGARRIIETVIWGIVVLVLSYLFWQSRKIVLQMAAGNRTTNILEIPYKYVYASVPIGCILTIINFSIEYYNRIFGKGNEFDTQEEAEKI